LGVAVLLEASSLSDLGPRDACGACGAAGAGGRRRRGAVFAARRGVFLTQSAWWDEFIALVQLDAPHDAPAGAFAQPAAAANAAECSSCGSSPPLPPLLAASADADARLSAALMSMMLCAGERPERPRLAEGVARAAAQLRAATAGYSSVLSDILAAAGLPPQGAPCGLTPLTEHWEMHLPVVSMCGASPHRLPRPSLARAAWLTWLTRRALSHRRLVR
jgi:hypothetical protein